MMRSGKAGTMALLVLALQMSAMGKEPVKTASDQNILDFLNLKFGMFIHYNMGTYTSEQWAYPLNAAPNDKGLMDDNVVSGYTD